ncbi:PREDICTED: nucleolin-like [Acropora digitifera]|uniref:nucleolin-like n=1 Tax=Acropora digitifera TaxID=70779 RepID=UPI00077B17BD|nr:PREDICTED: nucleolin-like [Acropora digitifera]
MVKAATQDTLENAGGLYDVVAAPPKAERKRKDTGPTKQNITTGKSQTDDNENPVEDITHLYCTVPKGVRKQNNSFRGLSMISEGEQDDEDEEQLSPAPEEESPALPPRKCSEEALAIYEIKRFLEESAKGEGENETCDEGKEANNNTDNLTQNGTGSAFQQLKAFLQQLDSTEEE